VFELDLEEAEAESGSESGVELSSIPSNTVFLGA